LRQQAVVDQLFPHRRLKVGELLLIAADRQERHPCRAQRRRDILGAEHRTLVHRQRGRFAVDGGFEADEVVRVARRKRVIVRFGKIDIG